MNYPPAAPEGDTSRKAQAMRPPVLCVDLDGTLVRSDTLFESALALLHRNPLLVFVMTAWLLRGRAHFKARVAEAAAFDAATVPYNEPLLAFLRDERARGRTLVLATASHASIAQRVAAHLGLFSAVHGSDATTNLKGVRKAELLRRLYGLAGFSYAGDSPADLPVWHEAKAAILVNASPSLRARLPGDTIVEREFPRERSVARELVRALRVHQWTKNLLLAVPLLTAHRYDDAHALLALAIGFASMSFAASAIYLVNDLFDLEADRAHPTKRARPFAAGWLPAGVGLGALVVLAVSSALLAAMLPAYFRAALGVYVMLALAYSLWFKHVAWLDVILLAALYTLRIYIGALAIDVPVSRWLFAYSLLVFASLALLKRYTELRGLLDLDTTEWARGYHTSQIRHVEWVGFAAALLSGVVLLGYFQSETVAALYRHPAYLWGVLPLLTYLPLKAWKFARGDRMHDDPVLYALTQWDTYAALAGTLMLILLARG